MKDLFYIDPLFKKTFLFTIPLVEFTKVVASGMFQVDDLFLALRHLILRKDLKEKEVSYLCRQVLCRSVVGSKLFLLICRISD